MISPSLVTLVLLPLWALFLFLSPMSAEDMCVVAGVSGRGTIATTRAKPPTWVVRRVNRSGVFSSKPMSTEVWDCDVSRVSVQ